MKISKISMLKVLNFYCANKKAGFRIRFDLMRIRIRIQHFV
jgi:hypothetical protein